MQRNKIPLHFFCAVGEDNDRNVKGHPHGVSRTCSDFRRHGVKIPVTAGPDINNRVFNKSGIEL